MRRLLVSAWSSLSKRRADPIRDKGLTICQIEIQRIFTIAGGILCFQKTGFDGSHIHTFSQVSVPSLIFSLVLGLESRLAKEPLESAWFAAEIATDEKAGNKSHNEHAKMMLMDTEIKHKNGKLKMLKVH